MGLTEILSLSWVFFLPFSLALFPKNLHFKTIILNTFSIYNVVPKQETIFPIKF